MIRASQQQARSAGALILFKGGLQERGRTARYEGKADRERATIQQKAIRPDADRAIGSGEQGTRESLVLWARSERRPPSPSTRPSPV